MRLLTDRTMIDIARMFPVLVLTMGAHGRSVRGVGHGVPMVGFRLFVNLEPIPFIYHLGNYHG